MQNCWRIVLPVIGIALFSAVSLRSVRAYQSAQRIPSKYFWWSSIRLNVDLANRYGFGNASRTEPEDWDPFFLNTWNATGLMAKLLLTSALPAFAVDSMLVGGFARFGIGEVSTFLVSMPGLIAAWYYFIGWLLERRLRKSSQNT